MTDLPDRFHNYLSRNPARLTAELLHHYSFELAGYPLAQQVEIWLEYYPAEWLPIALIEALYQGRYKAISVEQILNLWQRRNHPVYHFNHEFERLICNNLPQVEPTGSEASPAILPPPSSPVLSYRKILLELPSIRAVSRLDRLSEIPPFQFANRPRPLSTFDPEIPPEPATPLPLPTTNGAAQRESENSLPTDSSSLPADGDRDFKEFKEGVVFGLSSGLAVHSLKPRLRLELSQRYHPDWLAFLAVETAIAPSSPEPTASEPNSLKT